MKVNDKLNDTVIKNDYCIGCAACSFVDSKYSVSMDKFGMYKAKLDNTQPNSDDSQLALKVCPFSSNTTNEDEISKDIFSNELRHNTHLGYFIENYVGFVAEGDFRTKGSSGGFGKWILNELLITKNVDYVIQVTSNNEKDKLFEFNIFKENDNILNGSKSAYYPMKMDKVLEFIKQNPGKYAVSSLPCFSKALRNICKVDEVINSRLKFIISVVCGHLKSTGFAESLAWQLEVEPKNLRGIEFRDKIPGLLANEKGVWAKDESGLKSKLKSSKTLFGGNWGHGFFKYKACDYCDDVVGETADVSIGDAWIKGLMEDDKGNNVLVIRNETIYEIVEKAIIDNRLKLKTVNEDIIEGSQAGGIRHRREGLQYRLHLKQQAKEWFPPKRFDPSDKLPEKRKKIYKVRENLREKSHKNFLEAKKRQDFEYFEKNMKRELLKLGPPLLKRTEIKIKRKILEILGQLK